jgi:hypothetical protein
MNRLRHWVGIALLAPMLVLAVSTSSFVGIRCRMSGMVSLDTCCPTTAPGPAPAQSSMDEAGCCERIVIEGAKPISNAVSEDEGALRPPPSTPLALVAVPTTAPSPAVARVIAHGDPGDVARPPLRLLKHSLLI